MILKKDNKEQKNEKSEKTQKKRIEDKSVLNLNISNLTVSILYPIFIRWSESYKELDKNKKNNIYGEIQKNEKKEKKMKISIVTLYNYTGRQVILNNNALNEEDILNEMLNDEDDLDFKHFGQNKEIIEEGKSYDIEYKDIITKEEKNEDEKNNALDKKDIIKYINNKIDKNTNNIIIANNSYQLIEKIDKKGEKKE